MNENKTEKIKNTVIKIDIGKIAVYLQEYSSSKTLRRIISYSRRVLGSNNDKEIFRLSTDLAYYLDTICDANKSGYVKDETEKKNLLEISKELFENTIGVKDKK